MLQEVGFAPQNWIFCTGRIELSAERIANPQILLIVPQDNQFLPQGSYFRQRSALNGEKSINISGTQVSIARSLKYQLAQLQI
ncbi:hypothetical protein QUH73_14885 [Labilibaculum sp. K2S]|uniref:hypothetical protein n=1 Tax=Labilibaculum sp. K2S TaxID=3056386 RepID=UPI0025A3780E|nr:hypothetical protein [Labilibaculum sp. K2S]MDM8161108.1 hypothetical protein [Labilibaculum sp. K2S]